MARIARLVVPGFPHHVTQRGARKMQTFFCSDDYKYYLNLLASLKERYGVEIWAYCLMPNHVHMIAVPGKKNSLARLFREAHKTYARKINKRYGWQGHLWQERFRSVVLDEEHLLAAVRYVELNPVRAGICGHPDSWPWSSFAAHAAGRDDILVSTQPMLDRIVDWVKYIAIDESDLQIETIRTQTKTGRPIGSDNFLRELEILSGRDLNCRKSVRKP